ncbi:MAG: cytochrome c3 family protein [Pseudomonadota bacterium]
MNKNLFLIGVLSLLLIGGVSTGYAAVSGPCVDCHTMHNSQGGAVMGLATPQSALLLNNCLGCHTTTGSDPLVAGYPFVKLASGATDDNCLAGGFFPTTMGTGDNNDDHHGIGNTNEPAGFDSGETGWYTGVANGLGCAGTNGCHGNQTDLDDMVAISGGHHDPTAYRILYVGTDAVKGYGAKDYEEAIIANPATPVVTTIGDTQNVNIYSAGVDDPSISELCAKCHGDFHNESGTTGDVGTGSPWIRHPTDVAIPTTWAIGNTGYTPDGDDYKHNPVGYDNATFSITAKRATCLSCHRAHGTANNDLLRWAYSTQDAGSGIAYGCLGCHDRQR